MSAAVLIATVTLPVLRAGGHGQVVTAGAMAAPGAAASAPQSRSGGASAAPVGANAVAGLSAQAFDQGTGTVDISLGAASTTSAGAPTVAFARFVRRAPKATSAPRRTSPPKTAPPTAAPPTTAPPTTAPPTTPGPTTAPPTTVPARPTTPALGQSYQYELNSTPTAEDLNVPIAWWDIDAFDTPAAVVAAIHAKGEHAICYVDVGGAENWRPDYASFPASLLGNPIGGWPKERYVDVRQLALLSQIEGARLDMCKSKGFDTVDPDVLDAYSKPSGFPLTAQDQLRFNDMIAGLAHARGMSVALKGDPEFASQEVATFDFSIDEACVQWSECAQLTPFIKAGKAVFDVEYSAGPAAFCPVLQPLQIVGIEKHVNLDAWRATC